MLSGYLKEHISWPLLKRDGHSAVHFLRTTSKSSKIFMGLHKLLRLKYCHFMKQLQPCP